METTRTELDAFGEAGLITRLTAPFQTQHPQTVQGVGDDAAVVAPDSEQTVLSTELFVEGVHFDLSFTPLRHLGYKLVVATVSDVLAMNALPRQLLVGFGVSNRFSVEALEELYAGIRTACRDCGLDLAGGDTTSSRSGLIVSMTATGAVAAAATTYRRGARPNDLICVSGDLGGAYLGLQLLEREKQVFLQHPDIQPVLSGHEYVLERQLRPTARLDVLHQLQELGIVPTAMTDLSDGLAAGLLHLSRASGVGVRVMEEQMPIHQRSYMAATELKINPMTAALNGGEDYELLFTVGQEHYQKLLDQTTDINFVGFITADPAEALFITKNNEAVPLTAPGL